jgi:hypothetical protein
MIFWAFEKFFHDFDDYFEIVNLLFNFLSIFNS